MKTFLKNKRLDRYTLKKFDYDLIRVQEGKLFEFVKNVFSG